MKNICFAFLFLHLAKMSFTGAHLPDAIIFLSLAAMSGLVFYIEDKRSPKVNDVIEADVKLLKEEIFLLKSSLQSIKLGVGFRK